MVYLRCWQFHVYWDVGIFPIGATAVHSCNSTDVCSDNNVGVILTTDAPSCSSFLCQSTCLNWIPAICDIFIKTCSLARGVNHPLASRGHRPIHFLRAEANISTAPHHIQVDSGMTRYRYRCHRRVTNIQVFNHGMISTPTNCEPLLQQDTTAHVDVVSLTTLLREQNTSPLQVHEWYRSQLTKCTAQPNLLSTRWIHESRHPFRTRDLTCVFAGHQPVLVSARTVGRRAENK